MKTLQTLTLVLFAFLISVSISNSQDDVFYMDFEGKVVYEGKALEKASIKIYDKRTNSELDNVKTKNTGNFTIGAEPGFDYIFEISKKGFITQKVELYGKISVDNAKKANLPFIMGQFKMFKPENDIDVSLFDGPVLIINFSESNGQFILSNDDRDNLYNDIETFIKNKREYKNLLGEANSFVKAKKHEDALALYQKAAEIMPEESFPIEKIAEINDILAKNQKGATTQKKEEQEPITETIDKEEEEESAYVEPEVSFEDFEIRLKEALENNDQEEICILNRRIAGLYLVEGKFKDALDHLDESLAVAIQKGDIVLQADILSDIAVVQFDSGQFEKSIDLLKQSYELKKTAKDTEGMLNILGQLAQTNNNLFRQDAAINYYNEALELATNSDNTKLAASILDNIGNIYYDQNQLDKAIESYQKSLDIEKTLGNEENVAVNLNNIGIAYYDQGNYAKAEEYYQGSLGILEKLGNKMEVSVSLNNIGNVNYDWEKYQKALDYYEQSLQIKEDLDYKEGIATSLFNIGNIQVKLNNAKKAVGYYNKSIEVSEEIEFDDLIIKNLYALSLAYKEMNDVEKAFEFYQKYSESKYSYEKYTAKGQVSEMLNKVETKEKRSQQLILQLKEEIKQQKLLAKYESEKNKKALDFKNLELKKKEQEISFQRTISIIAIIVLLLIAVYSVVLLRQFKLKQKANKQLAEQKSIAEEQRDQIANQKREITDSITYAKRIQTAVLPTDKTIEKVLPEHFILFMPKDIVSGDFYWTAQRDDKVVFAVSDCTGHGVPGGFMSMLGISFLNEIISKGIDLKANLILDALREYVMHSLHQTGKEDEAKDGMDISLCVLDRKKKEMQYAGANNPLLLIRNKELQVFKPDKMPIGIHTMQLKPFNNNTFTVEKDDVLYLFSDGFVDQFGGPNQKKYSSKRLKEYLIKIHDKNLDVQRQELDNEIHEWMNGTEQIDDICVMGIKIIH